MHMADALISPAVGGVMLAASTGALAYSVNKVKEDLDDRKIPLMGVMGAFVFSAQMINFTIPATGSSGHMGGGILLAALLGPYAGFLVITSVLLIQALFFGDGGLLALGCNIFNMGFLTCFVAYPLIYRPILKRGIDAKKITAATILAVVIGLQAGAFGVVLETLASGKTELPFATFVALMQPIHLAIGLVEGIVVSAVLCFVYKFNPEILESALAGVQTARISMRKTMTILLVAALITGGFLSWFASEYPDGLEWAIANVTGEPELEAEEGLYSLAGSIQEKTSFLPDYGFKNASANVPAQAGTTTSGIVGGLMTLALAGITGLAITKFKRRRECNNTH